jgi:hypothetical protein
VEGDTARARWYLFMPCAVAAGNQAVWRAGVDHETYARVDGTWMFRHKRSEPLMSVPFETGWAKTRFDDLRAKVFEDRETPSNWRVEKMDEDGGYEAVKVFTGHDARDQAIRYAEREFGDYDEIRLEPYRHPSG